MLSPYLLIISWCVSFHEYIIWTINFVIPNLFPNMLSPYELIISWCVSFHEYIIWTWRRQNASLRLIRFHYATDCFIHSVSKESQHYFLNFSLGPGSGLCDPGSWETCKLSRKSVCRFLMTPGYMTLTLGPRKNSWINVAILLLCNGLFNRSIISLLLFMLLRDRSLWPGGTRVKSLFAQNFFTTYYACVGKHST